MLGLTVSAECVSCKIITSPHKKTGEIGSTGTLDLPVHLLASRLF